MSRVDSPRARWRSDGGHVERHPAELGDPDLGADPGARRGLAEDEPDGSAGEDAELLPTRALDLQLVREIERQPQLVGAPVGDAREATALERVRDARHGAMLVSPRRGRVPRMSRFTDALNEQIAYEFGASQQYIAIAVHYDAQTLPRLAAHFYRQALEERNHGMMMVQYLLDADEQVVVPAVGAPQVRFADLVAPVSSRSTRSNALRVRSSSSR